MNTDRTSDDVLRRYFLGTIDPAVREDVERRLFSDDRIFWERMCLLEDELIDAYVNEELDDDERQGFERHFLTTDERREKLSFARTLKAHVEREGRGGTHDRPALWGWVAIPSWAAAAVAVLLVLLPALTWQMARPRVPGDVSAWLSAGLIRSVGAELERVRVPPDARLVRLRLEVDGADSAKYAAAMHLATGEEVWSQSHLSATRFEDRQAVELILPAELLDPGDYYIRLRDAGSVVLGRYDFRVIE